MKIKFTKKNQAYSQIEIDCVGVVKTCKSGMPEKTKRHMMGVGDGKWEDQVT